MNIKEMSLKDKFLVAGLGVCAAGVGAVGYFDYRDLGCAVITGFTAGVIILGSMDGKRAAPINTNKPTLG